MDIFALSACSRLQEEYKRQDAGVTHKHHNAGVAAVLRYYSQVEDADETQDELQR
jgi:DNA gyrase inhibitor GyrI